MTAPAVRFQRVSKRFCMGGESDRLVNLPAAAMRWLLRRNQTDSRSCFWALHDVEFDVRPGESLGVIGPNGAGKSTILKLLAGILRPDEGRVEVHGRLAALLEVGAGFHGDLTGRENIFLNGAILGMNRREIRRKLPAIVAFAGLDRFMDMPVKRYSSGMYARLGFSIACHVNPDVLLVDEVLAVGDAMFRIRCFERMRELVAAGTTLIFVTHQLDQMQEICPRAIVLDGGRCTFAGPASEAVGQYLQAMSRSYAVRPTDVGEQSAGRGSNSDLTHLKFISDDGEERTLIRAGEAIRAVLTFHLPEPIRQLVVELNVRASAGENLLSFNSGRDGLTLGGAVGANTVALSLPRIPLAGGQYFWNVRIWNAETSATVVDTPLRFPIVVNDEGRATGKWVLEHDWSFRVNEAGLAVRPGTPSPYPLPQLGRGISPQVEERREDLLLR